MTPIEILIKQTESAYQWTYKLFDEVPESKWDVLAPGLETSLNWQLGHQVISIYYHTVMTTIGHVGELLEQLNLKQYTERCGYGTQARDMEGTYRPELLRQDLKRMQDFSLEVIGIPGGSGLMGACAPHKSPTPCGYDQIRSYRLEHQTQPLALRADRHLETYGWISPMILG